MPDPSRSPFAIPFVAGIIEREHDGQLQMLIQTRVQEHAFATYTGTIEFVAGVLDVRYEHVYEALAREIHEETGLTLISVIDDLQTVVWTSAGGADAAFGFRPFCCTQQLRGGYPWIGFIFRCRVTGDSPLGEVGETKDVRWQDARAVKQLFRASPGRFFPLEVPALDIYFRECVPDLESDVR